MNDDRVFSQDIPTDIIVEVGEATFSLHKVPKSEISFFSPSYNVSLF